MFRVIAFHLFLFAVPFILYAVYVYVTRRAIPEGGVFADAPLVWLTGIGLAMTAAAFFVVAVFTGAEPGGVYHPAELRDGKIVPGRIDPPSTEPEG